MENRKSGQVLKEPDFQQVSDGIYNIMTPPAFNMYLVLGEEKALLIDSGMGIGSLRSIVDRITALPVTLILTHGHPDHAGGNSEFPPALINPAEMDVYRRMGCLEFRIGDVSHLPDGEEKVKQLLPTGPDPVPVEDGTVLDLGGRKLTVFYTPGHTHGSLSIYDEKTGVLFTGDNTMGTVTSLSSPESSSVFDYAESLRKMKSFHPTALMGGHMPNINGPELLDKLLDCCMDLLEGAKGEPHQNWSGSVSLTYQKDGIGISYRESQLPLLI